jgi:hypothetical protein
MTEERRRWSDALAALRHAGVAMRRFERQSAGRPFEAQERRQADYDRLVDRYDAAMLRVVALPAPNLEALAFKTALIGDHRLWELDGGEDCLATLEVDVRRLAARWRQRSR